MNIDENSVSETCMEQLDDHCVLQICLALTSVQDLACLAMTCKRLQALITSSEQIWWTRLYHDFGIPFSVSSGEAAHIYDEGLGPHARLPLTDDDGRSGARKVGSP